MDEARKWTNKKLKQIERKILSIYSLAQDSIWRNWVVYMFEVAERIAKYDYDHQKAKKSGDKKLIRSTGIAYSRELQARTINNKRFTSLVEETALRLANVANDAVKYINGQLPDIFIHNYNQVKTDIVTSKVGQSFKADYGYSFNLMDRNTLDILIREDEIKLPTRKIDIPKEMQWNMKNIHSQFTQGMVQGESVQKIADRFVNVSEMSQNQAIRAARTMTTSVENQGRQESYVQATKDGVIMKKKWLSSDDGRTRDEHFSSAFDNIEVDIDDVFVNGLGELRFPGDPAGDPANVYNCRCSMAAAIKGFDFSGR